ncbi:hypothetical protein HCU74_04965 [Spongiibacter sp. KMU-166]|uniref:Uncharacterized protein n=1 Tax=Spongiibacter thalassae TaxID=2721624 RepID=A0ABX1GCT2_9GAMM|nr:hypothetical protein [Spongiibacter thalassae]NKI16770.1 hypothetical protein [Spongiibacter thalassae]
MMTDLRQPTTDPRRSLLASSEAELVRSREALSAVLRRLRPTSAALRCKGAQS